MSVCSFFWEAAACSGISTHHSRASPASHSAMRKLGPFTVHSTPAQQNISGVKMITPTCDSRFFNKTWDARYTPTIKTPVETTERKSAALSVGRWLSMGISFRLAMSLYKREGGGSARDQ